MVDMDDIDPEKARAALEQLEAEKEHRLQAKIDSGEVVFGPNNGCSRRPRR